MSSTIQSIQNVPEKTYAIWFSQRTGSTLLCQLLASTGIAGKPGEWLLETADARQRAGVLDPEDYRRMIWQKGRTPNGVCGVKLSYFEPFFTETISLFKSLPECQKSQVSPGEVWDCVFPNCRHIFMTRRNKIRLAVSWWKAIQSGEWHRRKGVKPAEADLAQAYSFDAINHLLLESVFREAGIQAFFSEAGVQPLTLVYEDFIADYAGAVRRILAFLGLEWGHILIDEPQTVKLADSLSEQWVARFRQERQQGWEHHGW